MSPDHAETLDALEMVEDRVATLFNAIKHGDQKHQDWLERAIEDHFAGRPVKREDNASL